MLKWLSLALVLSLAGLQYHLWVGEGGLLELHQVTARADTLEVKVNALRERNAQLTAEVVDLKTGLDAIEERARSDLGMVRNDEQFLWVPASVVRTMHKLPDAPVESSAPGQMP